MTAYLYDGANVGIWQRGEAPLSLIIAYPVRQAPAAPDHPAQTDQPAQPPQPSAPRP